MNTNYSALTRAGNHFIDWKTSTDPPRSRGRRVRPLLWIAALLVVTASVSVAGQAETQHGTKLVGTGTEGPSEQGWSVALSADGNTAIVGGIVDKKLAGAAWVFTRNGGIWTQQGNKLVGTGAVGQAGQGVSVALSADGNTAIVGGPDDNSDTGAAWVFTRSGGVWSQQGNKLVGTGAVGNAGQGASVALSADGNTAIVGGPDDNSSTGAAWVFTRSGGVWTQQGNKLVGTDAMGNARQGYSVALSADGNTAIVGGPADNSACRGGVGLHPQRRCLDAAGQQAGWHRRGWKRLARLLRCVVGRWQHRHRGRTWRQLGRRGGVGVHPQRGCVEPAGQQAGR